MLRILMGFLLLCITAMAFPVTGHLHTVKPFHWGVVAVSPLSALFWTMPPQKLLSESLVSAGENQAIFHVALLSAGAAVV